MTQVKSRRYKAHTGQMNPKRKRAPGWTKEGFAAHSIYERDMKTKRPDYRGNPK